MTTMTYDDTITQYLKYEHIKTAANQNITKLEAENLSKTDDDEILYVLSLNKSENITVPVLREALKHATNKTVKTRITQTIRKKENE